MNLSHSPVIVRFLSWGHPHRRSVNALVLGAASCARAQPPTSTLKAMGEHAIGM
jgi:hypothetical protein